MLYVDKVSCTGAGACDWGSCASPPARTPARLPAATSRLPTLPPTPRRALRSIAPRL